MRLAETVPAGTDGLCGFKPSGGHHARAQTRCLSISAPGRRSLKVTRRGTSRRGRAWDEDAIRAELTNFLRGWDSWPTYREFAAGGAKGLRDAIARIHGVEYWAREMKLSGGDRRRGGIRSWSDDRIHAALTRQDGASRPRERAARPASTSSVRRWPRWDDQTIAEELLTFLDGRDEWPRYREFVSCAPPGLYQAVLKHGGTRAWAARMGVRRVNHHGGTEPPES
jgi:hypothetical protein